VEAAAAAAGAREQGCIKPELSSCKPIDHEAGAEVRVIAISIDAAHQERAFLETAWPRFCLMKGFNQSQIEHP